MKEGKWQTPKRRPASSVLRPHIADEADALVYVRTERLNRV